MRMTIIKSDNMVYVDGHALPVDCSSLPADFHALQWYETWGDIEFNVNGEHRNARITDVSPYQPFIDAHVALKELIEKQVAEETVAKASALATGKAHVIID